MSLLENELVRKYFGEDRPGAVIHCDDPKTFDYEHWLAFNVLQAMQEPILQGERYLNMTHPDPKEWYVYDRQTMDITESFHPKMLRLPDAHQKGPSKKECGCYCHKSEDCHEGYKPAPEPERTHPYVWKGSEPERCSKANVPGHHAVVDCSCLCCKPSAVEDRIMDLAQRYVRAFSLYKTQPIGNIEAELRALVRLARER